MKEKDLIELEKKISHNEKTAKGNYKKINQYDLKGNLIKKWNSLKEAGETLNICKNNISSCLS